MAFIDFLYGTTVWKLGLTVSAIVIGGTVAAVLIADRCWHRERRRDHNDIAGFLIAVVGVVFAVLISTLALTVLTRQDRAQALVLQEAEAVEAIDRETDFLKPPSRDEIRRDVRDYLGAVLDSEWPQMRRAQRPTAAEPAVNTLWRDVAALPVENFHQMLSAQSFRQRLDKLADIRRGRSEIATTGVDRVIWAVVLLGSAATIVFAVLFGVRNLFAHLMMTGLLAFVIALAITMIIAIDWPYFGNDSVGPQRLEELRVTLMRQDGLSP